MRPHHPLLVPVLGVLVAGAAGSAAANPMSLEVVRARQVPETHHVQVTYGVDADAGVMPLATPTAVFRDGVELEVVFVEMDGSYTTNTGSGLAGVEATQFCDCDLEPGTYKYELEIPEHDWLYPATVVVEAGATRTEPVPPRPDAGSEESDTEPYPWEIPDPVEIQGLDCVASCGGTQVEPIAEPIAEGADDVTTPQPDVVTPQPDVVQPAGDDVGAGVEVGPSDDLGQDYLFDVPTGGSAEGGSADNGGTSVPGAGGAVSSDDGGSDCSGTGGGSTPLGLTVVLGLLAVGALRRRLG